MIDKLYWKWLYLLPAFNINVIIYISLLFTNTQNLLDTCVCVCVSFHSVYTDNQLQLLQHNTMTNVVNSLLHWIHGNVTDRSFRTWRVHMNVSHQSHVRMSKDSASSRTRSKVSGHFPAPIPNRFVDRKIRRFSALFFTRLMLQKQHILKNAT